jgi:hypothetical protein
VARVENLKDKSVGARMGGGDDGKTYTVVDVYYRNDSMKSGGTVS